MVFSCRTVRETRAARICDFHNPRPLGQEADFRNLPGPPIARPRVRRERRSNSSSAIRGANHPVQNWNRERGNHVAEPRFRRGEDSLPKFMQVTHRSLNDGTIEGSCAPRCAGLQRAVSPGSIGRPARQPLLFRRFLESMDCKARKRGVSGDTGFWPASNEIISMAAKTLCGG
jgi:hypothetical protein